jgi:hypothetical protein
MNQYWFLPRPGCCFLFVGLLLFVTPASARAGESCERIETLALQYAGVELSSSQQLIKRRLTAWYHRHCMGTRRS